MYNTLSFHNACLIIAAFLNVARRGYYKIVIVDGKEAKVTFHNFPDATKAN